MNFYIWDQNCFFYLFKINYICQRGIFLVWPFISSECKGLKEELKLQFSLKKVKRCAVQHLETC